MMESSSMAKTVKAHCMRTAAVWTAMPHSELAMLNTVLMVPDEIWSDRMALAFSDGRVRQVR